MAELDPAAAAFLAERAAAGTLSARRLSVEQLRAAADVSTVAQEPGLAVVSTDRGDVIGPGGTVPVRVLTRWRAPWGSWSTRTAAVTSPGP